jgi:hypothetical protein
MLAVSCAFLNTGASMQTFRKGTGNFVVDIQPRQSITITREGYAPISFGIGDMAVYDSYNLVYTGTISSITEKTVTIIRAGYQSAKRLKIDQFAFYNYDFDAERIGRENAETSWYI